MTSEPAQSAPKLTGTATEATSKNILPVSKDYFAELDSDRACALVPGIEDVQPRALTFCGKDDCGIQDTPAHRDPPGQACLTPRGRAGCRPGWAGGREARADSEPTTDSNNCCWDAPPGTPKLCNTVRSSSAALSPHSPKRHAAPPLPAPIISAPTCLAELSSSSSSF